VNLHAVSVAIRVRTCPTSNRIDRLWRANVAHISIASVRRRGRCYGLVKLCSEGAVVVNSVIRDMRDAEIIIAYEFLLTWSCMRDLKGLECGELKGME
jgi:hypothetical protein